MTYKTYKANNQKNNKKKNERREKNLIDVEVKSKVDEAVKEIQSLNQHIDELTAKQRYLQRQGKEIHLNL